MPRIWVIVSADSGARSAAAALSVPDRGTSPRDGRADLPGHQDPAQGELAHRGALWHERPKPLHDLQADLVVESGEGLAHVERLTVTIEVPVVIRGEGAGGRELAGEQPGCHGHAREHTHVMRGRLGQEPVAAGRCRTML